MKLLLLASWVTALHTYPQSSSGSGYNYSASSGRGLSTQSISGCSGDGSKDSCGGVSSAGGYPTRREPDSTAGSGGSQFAGYPAQMEMEQNEIPSGASGGDNQFGGYPSGPNQGGTPATGPQAEPKVQIQKHIYFHAAPPEPTTEQKQQQTTAGARQKHYTIIFIDTSRFSAPPLQQQIAAARNEEKTIVYVLVKKPEEQGDAAVSTGPMAPLNKPEVFFIKYKQQRDSKPEMPQTMEREQSKQEGNRAQYLPPKMA